MLLSSAILLTLAIPRAQERPRYDRRALLVGIGSYGGEAGSEWEDLYGPRNDVALMRAVLIEHFDFLPEQVLVLTDSEATHAGIVDAFYRHLIQPAQAGTEAVFYYSGHGSRAEDRSGFEASGWDGTFVCHDSARAREEPVPDLTDDELQSMLVALVVRGARAAIITDCCYSGGLTRGGLRARAVPAAAPAASAGSFLPPGLPFLEDGDPRRPESLPWVHVVASGADQIAHERVFELVDGGRQTHGVLTWYLARELQELQPGTSWEQLVARAGAAIYEEMWREEVARPQRPGAAGPAERMVFRGEFAAPLTGFPARTQSGRAFLKVEAGTLQFLEPGTRLQVRTLHGEALGFARVHHARISPTRCEAAWEEAPAAIEPGTALRVIPLESPATAAPVTVQAPAGSAAARAVEACAEEGVAALTADAAEAHVILEELGKGAWRARDAESQLALFTWDAGVGSAQALLAESLRAEQRYRRFLLHPDSAGLGGLELAWRTPDAERLTGLGQWHGRRCVAAELLGWEERSEQAVVRAGVEAAQVVELVVSMPDSGGFGGGFLSVLCVSEDRSITPIFPADGDPGRELAPGKAIPIAFEVFIPESWPDGLPQRDRYVAILTSEPLNLSQLRRSRSTDLTLRGAASGPARLQAMLQMGALRGGPAAVEAGASDYTFASCDLVLVRE